MREKLANYCSRVVDYCNKMDKSAAKLVGLQKLVALENEEVGNNALKQIRKMSSSSADSDQRLVIDLDDFYVNSNEGRDDEPFSSGNELSLTDINEEESKLKQLDLEISRLRKESGCQLTRTPPTKSKYTSISDEDSLMGKEGSDEKEGSARQKLKTNKECESTANICFNIDRAESTPPAVDHRRKQFLLSLLEDVEYLDNSEMRKFRVNVLRLLNILVLETEHRILRSKLETKLKIITKYRALASNP